MEKQPTTHTAASIARNIGIGVVTPVLAATVIYFLGFNRNDTVEFKKKKEATVKTWNGYMQNQEIFSAVFKQMDKSADIETTRKTTNHEIDVTVDNLENVKKEGNADQKVYSTIDIFVKQMKELKELFNKYFDDILTFAATNPTEEEGQVFIKKLGGDLKVNADMLKYRDTIRLYKFYEDLKKEYEVTVPEH